MNKMFFVLLCTIPIFLIGCDGSQVNAPDWNYRSLTGVFSVSENKQVVFSSGNLQYNQKTHKWKFADSQLECLGRRNYQSMDSTYDEYMDLFGWSTEKSNFGVRILEKEESFYGNFVDWGKNIGNDWFTLSENEWRYLFCTRPNANQLFGMARVDSINGCILLPDNWELSVEFDFTPGIIDSVKYITNFVELNNYTLSQWQRMEAAGAVFLPTAGTRIETAYRFLQTNGIYWMSTTVESYPNYAHVLYFVSNCIRSGGRPRQEGCSVRLAREVHL